MEIQCDYCGDFLEKPGALLFYPPGKSDGKCVKKHICTGCFSAVFKMFFEDIF